MIVLRVITKEEIQKYADRTREIRGMFLSSSGTSALSSLLAFLDSIHMRRNGF